VVSRAAWTRGSGLRCATRCAQANANLTHRSFRPKCAATHRISEIENPARNAWAALRLLCFPNRSSRDWSSQGLRAAKAEGVSL
jgi:hypothetical protein